jgi:Helix-turn-helix domain
MFEIGNSLRDARLKQGLDFSQVELATKIRAKYVRAIEEEQFDVLPAETYVKGFLRTYADHLGLDGQLYVDEYVTRFVVDELVDVKERRRAARRPRDHVFERRAVVLALAGIAALVALVIGAWKFGGSSPSTPSVLPPVSAPTAPQLRFSGPGTYIEIRRGSATGSVLYAGTLRSGESNIVSGKRFWILVRHPRGLRLRLDGKPVSLPARKTLKVLVTPSSTTLAG